MEWFVLGLKSLFVDEQDPFSLLQVVPSNLALDTSDFPDVHSNDVILDFQLQVMGIGKFLIPPCWNLAFFFPSGKNFILKNAASFFFSKVKNKLE